tara:strand:+ start:292 stop:555 length:264 start_codon:yes stop_codon:yes gene_type:complete
MMKLLNIFMITLVTLFFLSIYQYYSSNKNAELKGYNRDNINEIINTKISNLPVLNDDTNDVIEFNDGYSNIKKKEKKRRFWDLLKTQ